MKKILLLFLVMFFGISIASCENDENTNDEAKYSSYEIKISDGIGGEWIITDEHNSYATAYKLSFSDGKVRTFSCTHFRFTDPRQFDKWGSDWNENIKYERYCINCVISYQETLDSPLVKTNSWNVAKKGFYRLYFTGDFNKVWDPHLEFTVLVEVK